jgi:DNA-directed RNA polymerase specialized sigma24 family protein
VPSSQPTAPEDRLRNTNWGLVLQKLVGRARFMAAKAPDIFDGVSIEDVVSEVLVEFFSDKEMLGYNPNRGRLETFLWSVVKRKIIDHLRRSNHTQSVEDRTVRIAAERAGPFTSDPRPGLAAQDHLAHMKSLVSEDPDLQKLLGAGEGADGPNVNQEIAAKLNKTPREVVNLKKRLQRLVSLDNRETETYGRSH